MQYFKERRMNRCLEKVLFRFNAEGTFKSCSIASYNGGLGSYVRLFAGKVEV